MRLDVDVSVFVALRGSESYRRELIKRVVGLEGAGGWWWITVVVG